MFGVGIVVVVVVVVVDCCCCSCFGQDILPTFEAIFARDLTAWP
jgi:hypothetical protein